MRALLASCLLLAACAYDPPVQGDRSSPAFQKALHACQGAAEHAEGRRNGTPSAAFVEIFDFHETEHHDVQTCMQARGYAAR